jgi:Fe-S oxidoreductase
VAVSELVTREVAALALENRICYQCGQCTAACPSGGDLGSGPRRLMRLILTEQTDQLLASEDLWRCSGCGSCSAACPMELDVAGALARLRALERAHGGQRCPEREAATVATRRLDAHDKIDSMAFGAAMAARGFVPNDMIGAAGAASRLMARQLRRVATPATSRRTTPGHAPSAAGAPVQTPGTGPASAIDHTIAADHATGATAPRPFYPGCALLQDTAAAALTRAAASGLGLTLAEAPDAPCCGHPSRGASAAGYASDETVITVCPACDRSLEESGTHVTPLWEALVDHARRSGGALRAAAPAFVPYMGCLAERERALDGFAGAATLAGVDCLTSYPSLHSGCCGALGGMYRGETEATRRLLDYAAERFAPVVTTCLLCRDNLRSAARRRRLSVQIHFWPEFFSAAGPADATDGDV